MKIDFVYFGLALAKGGIKNDKGIYLDNLGNILSTFAENDSASVYLKASEEKLKEII